MSLDPHTHAVLRAETALDRTPKECAILEILLRHAGDVVSRSRLAGQVRKADLIAIDDLTDVHNSTLPSQVDASGQPALIQTVRGRGFRIAATSGADA